MLSIGKLSILAVGLVALLAFGAREISTACAPAAKPDAHGHGHGHGETEDGHAQEGFLVRACEDGVFVALKEQAGFGSATVPAKAETAGTESAQGKSHDGHDDGAQVAMKADAKDDGHRHGSGGDEHGKGEGEAAEGLIKLSGAQIEAAGINMAPALSGALSKEIAVPGRLTLNANAQAKVVPKLAGTVASIMKQPGETVAKDDVLATLESREMAEAKSEFLAGTRSAELAKVTFEREERLWKQKVTAEQDYLNAKNAHQEAIIRIDLAHQKLHALGLPEDEIDRLPKTKDQENARLYELRSPIAGRVIARDVILGQVVGTDREVFTIADLAKIWVEMSVAPQDLPFAREGQDVIVTSGGKTATAKVMLVNPMIDPDTRSAKVVAELDNSAGEWRLGDFVSARLISGKQEAALIVPRSAIQTVKGSPVVFVNEQAGFRARPVTTGREDSENVEILSGLEFAETIATMNTFTLKAELGKAEAEHEH
ncbi:MAG: efflux RND transporter periplasmic adaptor subunit [Hyphomicrobiaceae bacterium]|nr:efflux RND transporter periplasmic adaptor subunit [Hyphomicrobiaceae bacterium]